MLGSSASLVSALYLHEITAKEFADAVYFLEPEAAQIAVAMLSTTWAVDADANQRRLEASRLCRTVARSALAPI